MRRDNCYGEETGNSDRCGHRKQGGAGSSCPVRSGAHTDTHTNTRAHTQSHRDTCIHLETQRPDLTYPQGHTDTTHRYTQTSHTCAHTPTHTPCSHQHCGSSRGLLPLGPPPAPQLPGGCLCFPLAHSGQCLVPTRSPSQHPAPSLSASTGRQTKGRNEPAMMEHLPCARLGCATPAPRGHCQTVSSCGSLSLQGASQGVEQIKQMHGKLLWLEGRAWSPPSLRRPRPRTPAGPPGPRCRGSVIPTSQVRARLRQGDHLSKPTELLASPKAGVPHRAPAPLCPERPALGSTQGHTSSCSLD